MLLFLMAVAPVLPWRKASTELLARAAVLAGGVSASVALVLAVALGATGWAPIVAFGLAGFAAGSALRQVVLATRRQGWRGLVGRTNGGMIVHIGVIVIAVALAASNSYTRSATLTLDAGVPLVVRRSHVRARSTSRLDENDRERVVTANVLVDGRRVRPGDTRYLARSARTCSRRACAPGSPRTSTWRWTARAPSVTPTATIRVFIKPLVLWLWLGGGLMAVGTLLAAFPGSRRRRPTDPVSAPIGAGHLRRRPTPDLHGPASPSTLGAGRCLRSVPSHTRGRRAARRPADDVDVVAAAGADARARVGVSRRSSRSPSPSCSAGCSWCCRAPKSERSRVRRHAADGPSRRRRAVGDLGDGRPYDLARRKGSWVVLNFFDPECGPCVQEHPELRRLRRHRAPSAVTEGVELTTVVNSQVTRAGGRVLRRQRRELADRLRRRRRRSPTAFGVAQVPETWIVDPDGIVRYRTIGPVTADQLDASRRCGREAVSGRPACNRGCEALAGVAAAGRGRWRAVRRRHRPRRRRRDAGRAGRRLAKQRSPARLRRRERVRVAQPGVDQHPQPNHRTGRRGPAERRRDHRRPASHVRRETSCSCRQASAPTRSCGRCRWRRSSRRAPA